MMVSTSHSNSDGNQKPKSIYSNEMSDHSVEDTSRAITRKENRGRYEHLHVSFCRRKRAA